MVWKRPQVADFRDVIRAATSELMICSPFVTRHGLMVVQQELQPGVQRIEVWTRLNLRDWVTGASDADALLDFLDSLPGGVASELYCSDLLHAKFVIADGWRAMAGSANLTRGGLGENIEIGRLVVSPEIEELLTYVKDTRALLTPTTRGQLRDFVTRAQKLAPEREALIDLVRETAAPPPGRRPLERLSAFIAFCKNYSGEAADNIQVIYYNTDGNNRTGHLKQAFYAVQRFLQEYPVHIAFVAQQPADKPFDLRGTPVESDWREFITRFHSEADATLGYDISILVDTYLTPEFGGARQGGGGGDYPFKLVWPLVARMMQS